MKKHRKHASTVSDCIKNITKQGLWMPLPCRESEIAFINDFLENGIKSKNPSILIITGPKNSGKSSALIICSKMSFFESSIFFIDLQKVNHCHLQQDGETNVNLIYNERILIFDETFFRNKKIIILENCLPEKHSNVIYFFLARNCPIVIVCRDLPKLNFIPNLVNISCLNFSKYTRNQIIDIMKERMESASDAVADDVLIYIASKADGSVPRAFKFLFQLLVEAEMEGKKIIASTRSNHPSLTT